MQFGPLTRRELIALSGAAVAFPRAARTQQAGERRVGVLMGMVEDDPLIRTMRESPRYAEQPSLGNLFAVLLGPSSPVEPRADVYALDQRAV